MGSDGNYMEKAVFAAMAVVSRIYRVRSTTGASATNATVLPILKIRLIGLLLKLSNPYGNMMYR